MKRLLITVSLLVLTPSSSHLYAQYAESELQEIFKELLVFNGIENGWVDSDGDIQFTYNDHNYFIEINEEDNEFFRLVLFNIWPIESVEERLDVLNAIDVVNRDRKVVKAYTTNDNVWIAAELFISNPHDVNTIFLRCLEVIEGSIETFTSEM